MPETTAARVRAWKDLSGHRWWPYRACAPAEGAPSRARADRTVPVDVWLTPDRESQPDRREREQTAVALCGRCPVREQCLAYALGDDSGPYEEWDVWGGLTAHERALLLTARKTTAPAAAREDKTVVAGLDATVLQALAAHRTAAAVASAAGLTVTRANWHRSRLVTALGLNPRTATRMRVIYTARLLGLLDPTAPYLTDGTRLIAAIPSNQAALVRSRGEQLTIPGLRLGRPATTAPRGGTVSSLPAPPPAGPGQGEELEAAA